MPCGWARREDANQGMRTLTTARNPASRGSFTRNVSLEIPKVWYKLLLKNATQSRKWAGFLVSFLFRRFAHTVANVRVRTTSALKYPWREQAQEGMVLQQVQRLAEDTDVTSLSHHLVTPQIGNQGSDGSKPVHVLAVATSSAPGREPEIRIHRCFESLNPGTASFELYHTIAAPHGIYASGLAQVVYQGQLWLAVSCFSDSDSHPHAGHAESLVYRYSSLALSDSPRDMNTRTPPAADQVHSLPSHGATDVALWETPQHQLLLMISNFLGKDGAGVLGDVSVYEYVHDTQRFELLQSIAAQGAYHVLVFQPRGLSALLGIANRQVPSAAPALFSASFACSVDSALSLEARE